MQHQVSLKELRQEYDRAKQEYLKTNGVSEALYLTELAVELDRRLQEMLNE